MKNTPLVTVEWLHKNLKNPDLIILNASQPENKHAENENLFQLQIPGARWVDLKNQFSDVNSSFPNTFPNVQIFETAAQVLVERDFMLCEAHRILYWLSQPGFHLAHGTCCH